MRALRGALGLLCTKLSQIQISSEFLQILWDKHMKTSYNYNSLIIVNFMRGIVSENYKEAF
jgi:hypothetical protein